MNACASVYPTTASYSNRRARCGGTRCFIAACVPTRRQQCAIPPRRLASADLGAAAHAREITENSAFLSQQLIAAVEVAPCFRLVADRLGAELLLKRDEPLDVIPRKMVGGLEEVSRRK
ncbi:MAG: hypothetical protein ACI81R_000149 [Bradymonadia bacterium]|jgi:hypothetical protein